MSWLNAVISSPAVLPASTSQAGRRVTWLELFFDLVFVAAVAQVGTRLTMDYSLDALVPYSFLLLIIWWAWSGYALFATRFDSNDAVQRGVTFVQMIAVIFMAANAEDGLDSTSSAGFAAAYAVMRFVLVFQYIRASLLPASRVLALEYATGIGVAATLWLASAVTALPLRYVLWGLALATDLTTAIVGARHTETVPPDAAHLPERFGLFTLILFGESIVAVMKGIQSQPEWPPGAALAAFLGIGLIFLFWWWYFEIASAASERHVRCRDDARRFHVWSYAHLPLYLGLALTAVGVEHIVRSGVAHLGIEGGSILCGGVTVTVLSLSVLGATTQGGNALELRRHLPQAPLEFERHSACDIAKESLTRKRSTDQGRVRAICNVTDMRDGDAPRPPNSVGPRSDLRPRGTGRSKIHVGREEQGTYQAAVINQGRKSPSTQAGLPDGAGSGSTRYPSVRSSRIILRARTFLASALTAGPRSS